MKGDNHWITLTNIYIKLNMKIFANPSPQATGLTRAEASNGAAELLNKRCANHSRAPRRHRYPRLQDQVHFENVKSKD